MSGNVFFRDQSKKNESIIAILKKRVAGSEFAGHGLDALGLVDLEFGLELRSFLSATFGDPSTAAGENGEEPGREAAEDDTKFMKVTRIIQGSPAQQAGIKSN